MRFIDAEDATRVARARFGDDVHADAVRAGDDLSDAHDVRWLATVLDQSAREPLFLLDGFRPRERRRDGGETGVRGLDPAPRGVGFENDSIEWNRLHHVEVFLGLERAAVETDEELVARACGSGAARAARSD